MSATDTLVKPTTCRRCSGTGYVNSHVHYAGVPGTCFTCAGAGQVEGDRATIAAAKAAAETRAAASRILHTGDVGSGDLSAATATERLAAREYRAAVVWGWNMLEVHEPARHAKAAASILAGRTDVYAALAAYGAGRTLEDAR
jgi:hypothetical protein